MSNAKKNKAELLQEIARLEESVRIQYKEILTGKERISELESLREENRERIDLLTRSNAEQDHLIEKREKLLDEKDSRIRQLTQSTKYHSEQYGRVLLELNDARMALQELAMSTGRLTRHLDGSRMTSPLPVA